VRALWYQRRQLVTTTIQACLIASNAPKYHATVCKSTGEICSVLALGRALSARPEASTALLGVQMIYCHRIISVAHRCLSCPLGSAFEVFKCKHAAVLSWKTLACIPWAAAETLQAPIEAQHGKARTTTQSETALTHNTAQHSLCTSQLGKQCSAGPAAGTSP
jgi:hypothetical protein